MARVGPNLLQGGRGGGPGSTSRPVVPPQRGPDRTPSLLSPLIYFHPGSTFNDRPVPQAKVHRSSGWLGRISPPENQGSEHIPSVPSLPPAGLASRTPRSGCRPLPRGPKCFIFKTRAGNRRFVGGPNCPLASPKPTGKGGGLTLSRGTTTRPSISRRTIGTASGTGKSTRGKVLLNLYRQPLAYIRLE